MDKDKKISVSIYCKIYTDSFGTEMVNVYATGKEIYDYLMSDARHCFGDNGELIPGDCRFWYLGSNEKFGHMALEYDLWSWNIGESSFDHVEAFVSMLYEKKVVSKKQYRALMGKIDEGRLIDNMHDIKDYLICKKEGKQWIKKPGAENFRSNMKQRVLEVERSFGDKGYQFYK